jgi:hypothetical protein
MKKITKGARHGDIDFIPLKSLPSKIKKIDFKGKLIIAEGETTGHKHVLLAEPDTIEIYQDEQGRYVLNIKKEAKITHEEHGTKTFSPGLYIQDNEIEFDPFQELIRKVID